jgi:hypothetical protein
VKPAFGGRVWTEVTVDQFKDVNLRDYCFGNFGSAFTSSNCFV